MVPLARFLATWWLAGMLVVGWMTWLPPIRLRSGQAKFLLAMTDGRWSAETWCCWLVGTDPDFHQDDSLRMTDG